MIRGITAVSTNVIVYTIRGSAVVLLKLIIHMIGSLSLFHKKYMLGVCSGHLPMNNNRDFSIYEIRNC